ncbi:RNA polymerase sigma factor [Planctomicrobium sp. SH527]|uniref:RNA polymerase sigma factor n=1 Tax=Planctomicrobium sp. SH527 TaxID=3448123 RepID=UPI003F5AF2C2
MTDTSFSTESLHHLVDRIQNGDVSAKNELLKIVSDRLERLASRMLRTFPGVNRWEETGDILQASTLRLLRALESLKPNNTRAFFGLAAQQIRRELIDLNRHYQGTYGAGRHIAIGPTVCARAGQSEVVFDVVDPNMTASHLAELERWAEFHIAIDMLPPDQRELVGLVFYHGWTQAQIAELLELDVRTVRRYWQAACLRLHELLNGRLPESDWNR